MVPSILRALSASPRVRFLPRLLAAEDQQIGHGVATGRFAVRAGGSAESTYKDGQLVHFPACSRVRAVQGETGRQQGHHAARAGGSVSGT